MVIEALEKKVDQLKEENSSLYKQLYETQSNLTKAALSKPAETTVKDMEIEDDRSSHSSSRSALVYEYHFYIFHVDVIAYP